MRYVPDGDVRSLIDRVGPLPAVRACALIAQAASALDAAHARGLVHRDVKPTNMLLEISPRTTGPTTSTCPTSGWPSRRRRRPA